MNQKDLSDSVTPGPGFAPLGRLSHRPFHLRGTFPAVRSNHSGVTFLTRNPTNGSAKPVVRYWIPAFAGMTWLSIVFFMTAY